MVFCSSHLPESEERSQFGSQGVGSHSVRETAGTGPEHCWRWGKWSQWSDTFGSDSCDSDIDSCGSDSFDSNSDSSDSAGDL